MSDPQSCRWWVVTDLDGTLMDHHYDWSPAAAVLRALQRAGVPVIPCTSKTAEEVERFRADAQLSDPYIVENGGAIHGETATGEAWEEALGPCWSALKPCLQELSEQLAVPLRALDELTDAEGERLLGLSGTLLKQAQRRHCSVPFVPPSLAIQPRLDALAAAQGLAVVRGNRMCHLLGANVSKGNALTALKLRLGEPDVKVLALGDSPNDLPLLDVADLAVVVPGADGPHPQLSAGVQSGRFALARAAHAEGWAEAVERLLPGRGTIFQ